MPKRIASRKNSVSSCKMRLLIAASHGGCRKKEVTSLTMLQSNPTTRACNTVWPVSWCRSAGHNLVLPGHTDVDPWSYLDTLMWIHGATWIHWCGSMELPGHTDVDPGSYLDTLMWIQGATWTHWATWTHIPALTRLSSCSVLMFLPCLCHSDPPGLSLSPGLPPPLCLHPQPPPHIFMYHLVLWGGGGDLQTRMLSSEATLC